MGTIGQLPSHKVARVPTDPIAMEACKILARVEIGRILDIKGPQRDSATTNQVVKTLAELAQREDTLAVKALTGFEGATDQAERLDVARQHFVTSSMCWEALETLARESSAPDRLHMVAIRAARAAERWNEANAHPEADIGTALERSGTAFQEHVFELMKKEDWLGVICLMGEMENALETAGMPVEEIRRYRRVLFKEAQVQRPVGSTD